MQQGLTTEVAMPKALQPPLKARHTRHRMHTQRRARACSRGTPGTRRTSCLSRKLGAGRGRLTTGKCASGCANGTSSCAPSARGSAPHTLVYGEGQKAPENHHTARAAATAVTKQSLQFVLPRCMRRVRSANARRALSGAGRQCSRVCGCFARWHQAAATAGSGQDMRGSCTLHAAQTSASA